MDTVHITQSKGGAPMAPDSKDEGEATEDRGSRFPYFDLDASIEVARAIHNKGGGSASLDQLAAYLNHKGKSGTFLTKLASARTFGLIGNTVSGVVRATDRGRAIIAPTYPGVDDRRARVDAFLAVPLFGALYKAFKDRQLPPQEGLENALEQEFAVPKQSVKFARRSLISSARQAGFFEARSGQPTHLIKPNFGSGTPEGRAVGTPEREADQPPPPPERPSPGPHRAVRGAVDMLPDAGTTLTSDQVKGLVEAYRTALTIAYAVKDE